MSTDRAATGVTPRCVALKRPPFFLTGMAAWQSNAARPPGSEASGEHTISERHTRRGFMGLTSTAIAGAVAPWYGATVAAAAGPRPAMRTSW